MSNYTKGPWKWELNVEGSADYLSSKNEDGDILAWFYDTGDVFLPDKADRDLIAAAPDLLEAVEDAEMTIRQNMDFSDVKVHTLNLLQEAMVKAKGLNGISELELKD